MSEVEGVESIPDPVSRVEAPGWYKALLICALSLFAVVAIAALGLTVLALDTASRNDCRADLRDDLLGEVADGLIALGEGSEDRLEDAVADASRARERLHHSDTICASNLPGL